MVIACMTSRNEGDIVECSLRHMLAEGVDMILVADNSDPGEGTREALYELAGETGRVQVHNAPDTVHRQPALMNLLAGLAYRMGAEWVIASDVDEFWYSPSGLTVAEALARCSDEKACALSFQHHDWDTRQQRPKRLPKVAFRSRPSVVIANGNHDVNVPGGAYGVLDLRELQYRGFDHFKRKAVDRIATFDPAFRQEGGGWHHLRLEGMSDDELRAEWDAMLAIPTIHDPIPSRSSFRCSDPSI